MPILIVLVRDAACVAVYFPTCSNSGPNLATKTKKRGGGRWWWWWGRSCERARRRDRGASEWEVSSSDCTRPGPVAPVAHPSVTPTDPRRQIRARAHTHTPTRKRRSLRGGVSACHSSICRHRFAAEIHHLFIRIDFTVRARARVERSDL